MKQSFVVIIPARYASTRLPGKPLLEINGTSLLGHAFNVARRSDAELVYIATDDPRVTKLVQSFEAEAIMTSIKHRSGTDRLAEAIELLGLDDDMIVVNLQGDEFGMSEKVINQVAQLIVDHPDASMATICEAITSREQICDPNTVKIVFDQQGRALYFSRSVIPWEKGSSTGIVNDKDPSASYFRHVGLYAYRAGFLRSFTSLPICGLEKKESLEQLRALYNSKIIQVAVACEDIGIGVDTPEDLEQARKTSG